MNRLTLAFLVVFVAGLCFLAWRQSRLDQDYVADTDVPLFPGLDANLVTAVKIDNVERAHQMRFERDPKFGWMMVDPMRVRAENGILDLLVTSAVARRATPVPESEMHDLEKLGLNPARIVFALETANGARQEIKVGAVDLDRNRVHVLAGGKLLRAVRDFETLLDIGLDEYQSHNATTLDPRDVVELHRRGTMRFSGTDGPVDVTLDALFENGEWRSTAPVEALLDPVQMAVIAQGGAALRFDHVLPTGGAALATLGLDPPALSIEFKTVRDESAKLLFGPSDPLRPEQWNGTLVGDPTVWRIPADLAVALSARIGDLFDHRFTRLAAGDVWGIHLSSPEREVKLERSVFGWAVAEASAGSSTYGPPLLADPKKVADFLLAVGKIEVRSFAVERAALEPGEARDVIRLATQAGATAVASFGAPHATGGVRFQREGDGIVGAVDEAFRDLARTSAQAFWSTTILETSEIAVVSLAISRGERTRTFERDRSGKWIERGRTAEAKELHALLDPLLFLRARMHLASLAPNIENPIRVRWTLSQGERVLDFGRVQLEGQTTAVCDFEGRRSVLERPDLVEKLASLLAP
jgi:hypothetical protein